MGELSAPGFGTLGPVGQPGQLTTLASFWVLVCSLEQEQNLVLTGWDVFPFLLSVFQFVVKKHPQKAGYMLTCVGTALCTWPNGSWRAGLTHLAACYIILTMTHHN